MNTKIISNIALTLGLKETSVRYTIELLNDGCTVPFISRYRKERTGNLDEVEIGNIQKEFQNFNDLLSRKETVLKAIKEQGKLTPDLEKRISGTFDTNELEDIYLPFKRKKKSKAGVARENGLEPLALEIKAQKSNNINALAKTYINDDIQSIKAALEGAQHIIAVWISEDEKVRDKARRTLRKYGKITSKVVKKKKADAEKYRDYFDFEENINKCPSHRFLAIERGQSEGFLRVTLNMDDYEVIAYANSMYVSNHLPCAHLLKAAIEDGYKRLILPSVETQIRNEYKEKADLVAIDVFTKNLRQLLLSPPLGQKATLAIDPGFRTGCKVVALDNNGNLLSYKTLFINAPQNQHNIAEATIKEWINKYNVESIAIGNGTAGRETESFIKGLSLGLDVFMVNEDGASIYSASEIARNEFPDHDVTVRGAVSIGRRLMDPLSELVKIDAKSVGVGQYQHDVNQTLLKSSLDKTVESCVNTVGVTLNTASQHLLTYISGLGEVTANNIVKFRKEKGQFTSINQLKKVPRIGDKAYEQAAGILRIRNGKNPLDNTGVHPESYHIVKHMAEYLGIQLENLIQNKDSLSKIDLNRFVSNNTGLPTLKDIIKELEKPGLDPRGQVTSFSFDPRIKEINDVIQGMILPGIVTNITNFGAFVDIGTKHDGLVHISQIANRFISNPADVLSLNQKVNVKVLDVDYERGRINLSMKEV
jgi:uncharacterized protein